MSPIYLKVFLSCCASNLVMELLMFRYPQSSNLITFLQFLFVTVKGFFTTVKFGTVTPSIPLRQYVFLVTLFFLTSTATNYVYTLHVSTPLHMIIRSATLPASMLVAWLFQNRAPRKHAVLGSLILSGGVMLAMYGGAKLVEESSNDLHKWLIGVSILVMSLFTGAFTGLQQEKLYTKYGKHPEEMMFYINALPLPFFAVIYPSIKQGAHNIDGHGWILVAVNMLCQYFCLHYVHVLATRENSVTVTLILTLRKFLSLLISAIVFQSFFTVYHFYGTLLVVIGTVVYFDLQSRYTGNIIKKYN